MKKVLSRYRYSLILLKQLVKTDFKLRYQNSLLGYLWSLLKPLFLFGIMYIVFVKILKVDYGVSYSGVYLLLGLVIWTLFSEITGTSVGAIVARGDLLRKINFPRYSIVFSTTIAAVINFLLNLLVVVIFMAISRIQPHWEIILIPFLIIEAVVFSLAIAFFLSASYVKLRDIGYVWEVIMQALFYLTPIFFPLSMAPHWVQKVLIMNPIAQVMQDLRYLLVSNKTITIESVYGDHYFRILPILISIISIVFAGLYFKSRSKYFAEEV